MNKYTLNSNLKKHGITNELMDIFSSVYELDITDYIKLNFIISELLNKNRKPLNYAKDLKKNFKIEQYLIYNDYTKLNKKDTMSKEYHKAKYGNQWKTYYRKRKKSITVNLEYYLNKYGEDGYKKYLELNKSKRLSKENFIKKYGTEQGLIKWKSFCERNAGNLTLKRQIDLHGKENGIKRYNIIKNKFKSKNTLKYYIDVFGIEEGTKRYKNKNKKNSDSSKKNSIWVCNTPAYNVYRQKQEKLGKWVSLDELTEFQRYYRQVWNITNKQNLSNLPNFDKRGHQRIDGTFSLDHIISIKYGFTHNISCDIIGNIDNLQFIPHFENSKKRDKCYSLLKYNKNSIHLYGD